VNALIGWFASNRVAANLLMWLVVLGGLFAVPTLRQETYPNVALDFIAISVVYPGAAPDEVESAICVRIEEAIHGVDGIARIFSRASEGYGAVWAQLEVATDARRVLDDITTRIDTLDTLPEDAERPAIEELIDDSVLLGVVVHGDVDDAILRSVGERVREEISSLPEVSRAELVGLPPYEVAIEIAEADLRRHDLRFDDVARAVRGSSVDLPGGSLKTAGGEILMRAQGRAYRGPDFERLVLLSRVDGTRLHLGEVARVVDGFAESDERVRFDGQPAAVVRLLTSEKENVLEISGAVRAYAESVRSTLPEGVRLAVWRDQSREFESRRNLLLRNGAQGLVLILIVLGLFQRLHVAFWVSAGIPIAFLGSMIALSLVGISINMMSLFAFIVALGLIVDDAIVVGENVARHQAAGRDSLSASIAGATEVAKPVTVAVLTSVMFMIPALALPTVAGKIAKSLAVVTIACLVFSLVEALWILPSHLARRSPVSGGSGGRRGALARVQQALDARVEGFIRRRYLPLLARVLRWPALTVSLASVALMLSVAALTGGWVRYAFFPRIEDNYVTAHLVLPEGTPPATVASAAEKIEREALLLGRELDAGRAPGSPSIFEHVLVAIGDPPDRHDDSKGGGDGPNQVRVIIQLVSGEQRVLTSLEVEERWRDRVGSIPGAESLHFYGTDFANEAPIDVSIAGADRAILARAAAALKAQLAAMPGVRGISDSLHGGKQELVLRIRPEAEARGLTLAGLVQQIRQGFHGEEVQRVQRGRDDVGVVVRYPPEERRSLRDLEDAWIRVPGGAELPFAAVASAELGEGFSAIERRDRKSNVNVRAHVDKSVTSAAAVMTELEARALPRILDEYPGLVYAKDGQSRDETELATRLYRDWALALFAAYGVMAVALRSHRQALLVLTAVPFGLVGAVVGHALLGLEFSAFSMIGLVALTGVVVNDALVLIDRANLRHAEGASWHEALADAGATRFRAILLTSLTTFFGLLPLLFERSAQAAWLKPMAVTLSFGVLLATGITLVLVPACSVIADDLASWGHRVRATRRRNRTLLRMPGVAQGAPRGSR
jgi:multidrug efflux pump subunit AcrB